MYSLWFMSTFPAEALPRSVCSTEGESVRAKRYSIKGVLKGNTEEKKTKRVWFWWKQQSKPGGSHWEWLEWVLEDVGSGVEGVTKDSKNLKLHSCSRKGGSFRRPPWFLSLMWCGVWTWSLFGAGGTTIPHDVLKNKDRKWAWCLTMKAFSTPSLFVLILVNYAITTKHFKRAICHFYSSLLPVKWTAISTVMSLHTLLSNLSFAF